MATATYGTIAVSTEEPGTKKMIIRVKMKKKGKGYAKQQASNYNNRCGRT